MATIRRITDEEKQGWQLALPRLNAGHHSSTSVYKTYSAVMREHGRTPVHPIRLGQILAEYGAIRRPKWVRNVGPDQKGQMRKGWVL